MKKIGFTTYDTTIDNSVKELTVEQAGAIVTAYASKTDLSTAKGLLGISRNVIAAAYADITEVESGTVRAMKGASTMEYPTYDEEGIELTPIVYNEIPTTLTELKDLVFLLVDRDYAKKVVGVCTIEDVAELRLKVEYCIDQLIK